MAGGDGASYDGFGDEDLDFRCAPGDLYSVSVHKLEREYSRSAMLRLAVITKDKILDQDQVLVRAQVLVRWSTRFLFAWTRPLPLFRSC